MNKCDTVTGVLLAGGKSRRMGEDKRFVKVGGMTLLERALAVLNAVFSEVVVVVAQDSPPLPNITFPVIRDAVPDCGSLGGLYTGLAYASRERIFAVACDMPFLRSETIRAFVATNDRADIVMASLATGLQPMHAVYGKRCLPVLERMIRDGVRKIQLLVAEPGLSVRLVTESEWIALDPDLRSFQNVNTPADLVAAQDLLARQPSSSE